MKRNLFPGIQNRNVTSVEGLARREARGRRKGTRGHQRDERRRERDVYSKVHERERERHVAPERDSHARERERESTRTGDLAQGVLLIQCTRKIQKGRESRVTSCHSVVPSTYPPIVYEMSADRWNYRLEINKQRKLRMKVRQ